MSAENILLQMLRSNDILPDINEQEWIEIIDLAAKQHIMPYLYYHLKEISALSLVPAESRDILHRSFKQSILRNMALIAEFRRIADALAQKGIPVIGLKGLQLIQDGIYPHIGLRFMRDIDLLVPANRIKDAYKCSVELGYKCEKTITEQDFSMPHHHLHQQFHPQKQIILELHRCLTEEKNIDMDQLWGNARALNAQQYSMFFDTEDLLLHLCLHISYNDLFKIDLRHYLDIYMVLQNRVIDCERFLHRSQTMRLTKGVLLVLDITSRLFRYELPSKLNNAMVRDAVHEELIKQAIYFMWRYSKSSKDYELYRSKMFLSDEPLLTRLFRRVFISKEELSFYYSIDSDSPKVYPYYFKRIYDLFSRHFINMIKSKIDQKQIDSINKTKILYTYLFEE